MGINRRWIAITIEQMEQEKKNLEQQIERLEREIAKKPEGTLTYIRAGSTIRYYAQIRKDGKRKRIYLKDQEVAAQLAIKKVQMRQLKDAQNELEAVKAYLKKKKSYSTTDIFECDAMRALLMPVFETWANAEYESNPYHREKLTVEGANGVFVASKSEGDMSWGLHGEQLPNRYEQKMILGGKEVYPDFTIIHPLTGRKILWEHFGMMDKEDYVQRTYDKLSLYIANGYFPGDNLIVTFEDRKHPLSNRKIHTTIQEYFGDWMAVNKDSS